eukprot:13659287-Alexandrium_andersonii.AAC.1
MPRTPLICAMGGSFASARWFAVGIMRGLRTGRSGLVDPSVEGTFQGSAVSVAESVGRSLILCCIIFQT